MGKDNNNQIAKLAIASLLLGAMSTGAKEAEASTAFRFQVLGSGGQIRSTLLEGQNRAQSPFQLIYAAHNQEHGAKDGGEAKCGEGKCGENKEEGDKTSEGKCGEGKCGDDKSASSDKTSEGKCGEGKCG